MPINKKQHFVPQFYLKYFSLESLGKTIGVYNIRSSKFISNGKLKNQAYRNYFYGHDLNIENALSEIEGRSATVIQNILTRNVLPVRMSGEHYVLSAFTLLLNARTVYSAEQINEFGNKLLKAILSKDSRVPPGLDRGKFALNQPTHINLRQAALLLPFTFDLHFKLIINKTRKPFVTSDHPVVLYNQFLEDKKNYGSNTGIACKGLEIFIPLSPSHLLIFFDRDVYKVGSKSNLPVVITSETDVENLNLLQCISANENLYFNQEVTELQIRHLMRRATQYRKTTKANVNEFTNSQNNKEIRVLLHTYTSDVKCRLSLDFVHMLKKARQYNLGDKVFSCKESEAL